MGTESSNMLDILSWY